MMGRAGEWYFPDGTAVPIQGGATSLNFYRNRGDDGTVNLNRLNTNVITPTVIGLFCCEVPDATGAMQRLCINIGELEVNFLQQ